MKVSGILYSTFTHKLVKNFCIESGVTGTLETFENKDFRRAYIYGEFKLKSFVNNSKMIYDTYYESVLIELEVLLGRFFYN